MRQELVAFVLVLFEAVGCKNDDQTRLGALQSQVDAQQKRIAEQEQQIAELRRQLAAATAHAASPAIVKPSTDVATDKDEQANDSPWKLTFKQINHSSSSRSFHARVAVANVTTARHKGSVCVQLLDRGGTEVEHFVTSDRAVPGGATEIVEIEAPLTSEQWNEVARMRAFVAPFGCNDEPPANALVVDRQGRVTQAP
jgi:hypothetical protein